jgi:indolepyruvate ferredoxin oxidoreductase
VIDYQNAALGRCFLSLVARVAQQDTADRSWELTRSLCEAWFRVLTYKDEYEVARLHHLARYDLVARDLGIEGSYSLKYHLHPPFLRRLGRKSKLPLGWLYALAFAVLLRMKPLRGTLFDPFGWDRDRRLERAVIHEYRQLVEQVLAASALAYTAKVERVASALAIKGYGPIKERAIAAWRARVAEWTQPSTTPPPRSAT